MRIRRSYYRLCELSCFLYIFSLPFYFDICCFIAVTLAFLCPWPITTEFLKGSSRFFPINSNSVQHMFRVYCVHRSQAICVFPVVNDGVLLSLPLGGES
jgi:hypothetical protein